MLDHDVDRPKKQAVKQGVEVCHLDWSHTCRIANLSHQSVMGDSAWVLPLRGRPGHVIAMDRKPKNHLPARQPPRAPASQRLAILRSLSEVEGLIRPPLLPSQLERANGLALAIARNAPDAVIAMLGTRLVRAIQDARAAGESADIRPIALIVAQVRAALDQPV